MGDSDSVDFDILTIKHSKATPPPGNLGFTNVGKAWWDSFIKQGEFGCCQASVGRKKSSFLSMIRS